MPWMQSHSWEYMARLSLEWGGIRVWLELPSTGRSTAVWAFLQKWVLGAVAESVIWARTQHRSVATVVWQ